MGYFSIVECSIFAYSRVYSRRPQLLGCKNAGAINQLNVRGESALHAACLASQPDNLEHLLRWGANPLLSQSHRFPIHCAVEQDDMA